MPASLDTTYEIVTPENIAFRYHLAGPFRRFGAWLVDVVIKVLILILLGFLATMLSALTRSAIGIPLLLISYFILSWFYGGFFEAIWNGQTPGKRMVGLRVVGTGGQPIMSWQAVLRSVLRDADLMPFLPLKYFTPFIGIDDIGGPGNLPVPLGLVGLVSCLFSKRFQRLGDLASGTMVVVEERPYIVGLAAFKDIKAKQIAADLPIDLRVSRSTAKALAKYVERRQFFTAQRRAELSRRFGAPLRQHYAIPKQINDDMLLCGLYYRTFIGDET
ncbi:MAG: RDD family protein [Pirellulales bacterium]